MSRLSVLCTLFVSLGSATAFAGAPPIAPVCEDEISTEPSAPEPVRVILPCAVADGVVSGGYASCADADFYVVTTDGEVLCEIDLPLLSRTSAPQLERAPPASHASTSSLSAAALPSSALCVPAPLVRELAASPVDVDGGPADGFARAPTGPS